MVIFMKETGKIINEMVKVNLYGKMVVFMKVIGKIIKNTAKVKYS